MGFEQATIKVVKRREFDELKAAIEQVFAGGRVAKYLKALDSARIQVRDLEAALAANALDEAAGNKRGTAAALYGALAVSDQGQMREFYLFKIEEVEPELRTKFRNVYQYS